MNIPSVDRAGISPNVCPRGVQASPGYVEWVDIDVHGYAIVDQSAITSVTPNGF